jgi:hypothetical protein
MVPGLVGDEIFSVSGFKETHARRREAGDHQFLSLACKRHSESSVLGSVTFIQSSNIPSAL